MKRRPGQLTPRERRRILAEAAQLIGTPTSELLKRDQ